MAQRSPSPQTSTAQASTAMRIVRPLAATALVAAMLTGLSACGPDTGPAPEASGAPSAAANSAAAARASQAAPAPNLAPSAASPAPSPAAAASAPACPKLAQPQCPPAAAALPNALAAPIAHAERRVWVHCRRHRRHAHRVYARVWRGERPTHVIARSETVSDQERVVERYRAGPVCQRDCAPRYHTYDYAGIDARGYLVWPGKVEY